MKQKSTYLFIVDKVVSEKPSVSIVKDFSKLYTQQVIDITMKATIDIYNLPAEYLV